MYRRLKHRHVEGFALMAMGTRTLRPGQIMKGCWLTWIEKWEKWRGNRVANLDI